MVVEFFTGLGDAILSPILNPLLSVHPALAILIVALAISAISVWAQKQFTDQDRLKFLKKEQKKINEEIRKNKDNPEKQMKLQKKIMPISGEMMKASLKPTLWMMIPFFLIFMWLAANFAYEPLLPGENFTVTADAQTTAVLLEVPDGLTILTPAEAVVVDEQATWTLVGEAGRYVMTFSADDSLETMNVFITETKEYAQVMDTFDGDITRITIGNAALKPLDPFTILGWRPGWIWIYIFCSIIISISLRKWLDVA